ncbi:integrase catalytic domain-containing protein [Nephila pilipes]|uniref:Integrase catalytic domain-containing protein n=1 Tax=Nephila pilipes TaxID=299642 RepID=A0A8X6TXS6_NEPPI|nr:integrase catalytic domain-containing protein [Nephila pilipes]
MSECVKVQLLRAKSRISPTGKKKTTIARLELYEITITARLASSITCEIPQEEIYFWSDLTTVITWIKRENAWVNFVQNRVSKIGTLAMKENWRHVLGSLNPADLPSRGCFLKKLIQSKWYGGPDWLYLPAEKWPCSDFVVNEDEVLKEWKKTVVSSSISC